MQNEANIFSLVSTGVLWSALVRESVFRRHRRKGPLERSATITQKYNFKRNDLSKSNL